MTANYEPIPAETLISADESARQKLQDNVMQVLREMPSDWRTMSEEAQERFITRVDGICENLLKAIIRHLATDGRKVVRTTVESLQVKDSLKVQLTAQKTSDNVADIGNAQGSWCYIIMFDEKNNLERKRPTAERDEPGLPMDEDDE